VSETQLLTACPVCQAPGKTVQLFPLSFDDIDQALAEASKTNLSTKRGKKRQNATVTRLNPTIKTNDITAGDEPTSSTGEPSDLRTGRWTPEEIAYCDKLIEYFSRGCLPIPEKLKLNDFLSNMLKSKQSRLTKKMKNARFSAKQYVRTRGATLTLEQAREFSQLETGFFASMKCNMERSEIRFHMQKVWRELFSSFCVSIGQKVEVDAWLKSVEDLDRRNSDAKDAARRARRKMMMGAALRADTDNVPSGVFIDRHAVGNTSSAVVLDRNGDFVADDTESDSVGNAPSKRLKTTQSKEMAAAFHSSPYVARVIQYVQRRGLPFEHVDIWVPSFVSNPMDVSATRTDDTCRLCFAGCATADAKVPANGLRAVPMNKKEKFNMISFGVYSQKFSFVVGSGLPGRIYGSGVPSWEQGVQSAPQSLFERVGGAEQWGVETVLGIPVSSPSVGRVVVLFYSVHDRPRDADMVNRMAEELTHLVPSPRWKLVVEVGETTPTTLSGDQASGEDLRIAELLSLIEANMPADQHAPLSPLLPGITSLRLLLLKPSRTPEECESLDVALNTYESYKIEGRSASEIVGLTSRTFMVMARQPVPPQPEFSIASSGGTADNETTTNANSTPGAPSTYGSSGAGDSSFGFNGLLGMGGDVSQMFVLNSPTNPNHQMTNTNLLLANSSLNGNAFNASVNGFMGHFNLPRSSESHRGLSPTPFQSLPADQFNEVMQEFGGLDASTLNNLPNGVSASQLAALLQNEPNFTA
jgi:hypothetical protein